MSRITRVDHFCDECGVKVTTGSATAPDGWIERWQRLVRHDFHDAVCELRWLFRNTNPAPPTGAPLHVVDLIPDEADPDDEEDGDDDG